ncbi:Hypothetical protein PHPALM_37737, partial [Phytophthora palmivora]
MDEDVPCRAFVPAKQDVGDLAELADLEKEVDEYDDWWAAELAIAGYDSIYATSAVPAS